MFMFSIPEAPQRRSDGILSVQLEHTRQAGIVVEYNHFYPWMIRLTERDLVHESTVAV